MVTRIAFVGCGFVADFYQETLKTEHDLELAGVYDRDQTRAEKFAKFYGVPRYPTLADLLNDQSVSIVVNLTNPREHVAVTKEALKHGKHVYSEKPFAMSHEEAEELYELATAKGLEIVSAPCNLFGEAAQTIWRALKQDDIGRVRLVYAEMDDGPVHLAHPEKWQSKSGTPWPIKDEFEVGCTLEHAGYYVSWLVAFFGPAVEVFAYSDVIVPDKGFEVATMGRDFSVALIRFKSGVTARLTCSIYAPHNHALQIVGDKGVISIDESWHNSDIVKIRPYSQLGFKAERYSFIRRSKLLSSLFGIKPKTLPFVRKPKKLRRLKSHHLDFCRGISELAEAIKEQRPARLGGRFCVHVNEIVLAIHGSYVKGAGYTLKSSCEEPKPLYF